MIYLKMPDGKEYLKVRVNGRLHTVYTGKPTWKGGVCPIYTNIPIKPNMGAWKS